MYDIDIGSEIHRKSDLIVRKHLKYTISGFKTTATPIFGTAKTSGCTGAVGIFPEVAVLWNHRAA
jgi:hypothetical protein